MNATPNDPIARVAQRWVEMEYASELANGIRCAAILYVAGEPVGTPGDQLAKSWTDRESQCADFVADINRAVADWLRGVSDELDPDDWVPEPDARSGSSVPLVDVIGENESFPSLKPCPAPWCMSDPRVVIQSGHPHPYYVECAACDEVAPRADTPEVAAEHWNNRPQTIVWVPVGALVFSSEVDPTDRAPCLVLDDAGDVGVGFWDSRVGWSGTDTGMSYGSITHWARVPMPGSD